MLFRAVPILLLLLAAPGWVLCAVAQQDINQAPIFYDSAPVTDAVAQLQQRLDSGQARLEWHEQHGWLPSLLELLEVPRSSQTLVFSKTSLQITKISPERPRALYFNDNVYLGTVQHGDLIEVSAVDPKLGAVFYSLAQRRSDHPRLVRDDARCLSCHHTLRTNNVPGYLLRSVFTQESGEPRFDLGGATTDPTSDFADRYGGWYVTGTHGAMRHRGNTTVAAEGPAKSRNQHAANLTDLSDRFDTNRYLTPHSDLVALMVLEHQAHMHNAITRAAYEARQADHYDKTWNKILDKPARHQSDVSKRRIADAGEDLLAALLFSGEHRLTSPIAGASGFSKEFQAIGPRDPLGRSLRQLDLQTRIFKHPCSYLIYSESFESLPAVMRRYLDRRLKEILTGKDATEAFAHLSAADRKAIREILADTLPEYESLRP
ncbi:MAG: hypothetical protein KDA37_07865 [Planctomycetales bacterium]|nr:hypothetical protein [Planctomycetales bacterium]